MRGRRTPASLGCRQSLRTGSTGSRSDLPVLGPQLCAFHTDAYWFALGCPLSCCRLLCPQSAVKRAYFNSAQPGNDLQRYGQPHARGIEFGVISTRVLASSSAHHPAGTLFSDPACRAMSQPQPYSPSAWRWQLRRECAMGSPFILFRCPSQHFSHCH